MNNRVAEFAWFRDIGSRIGFKERYNKNKGRENLIVSPARTNSTAAKDLRGAEKQTPVILEFRDITIQEYHSSLRMTKGVLAL
jgi:hypothetical protein